MADYAADDERPAFNAELSPKPMTPALEPPAFCQILLDRHAAERSRAIPTVSLLAGPTDPALQAWQMWCSTRRKTMIVLPAAHPTEVPKELIGQLALHFDWRTIALRRLREAAGTVREDSHLSPTGTELDALRAAAESPDPSGSLRLAAELLRNENSQGRTSMPPHNPVGLLRSLAALLEPDATPGILLIPPESIAVAMDLASSWLSEIAPVAWQLTHAAGHWPLAVVCPLEAIELSRVARSSSREQSFLRSGLIRLQPEVAEGSVPPAAPSEPARYSPLPPELERLVVKFCEGTAPPPLRTAHAAAAALRPRRDDAARSAAERLLFEMLQLHPRTRGRFALNAAAEFQFGSRAAEIDLLAAAVRLAVEVDGYHHFADPGGYRRDRRKDLLLQQHGYTVCRVLADDVMDRPDDVLDIIVAAVDHAARHFAGEKH